MKTLFSLALLCLLTFANAQNEKLTQAILKGKNMITAADTITEYQAAANYFERIKNTEKSEWLPAYYFALSKTLGALSLPKDQKEEQLLIALGTIQEVMKTNRNSELLALEGFVQMMRLTIDPATRGQSLSPQIYASLSEATQRDGNNPRAWLILGQMEMGTAQFFGTPVDQACAKVQKAIALFEAESGKETILPTWGSKMARTYTTPCNQ